MTRVERIAALQKELNRQKKVWERAWMRTRAADRIQEAEFNKFQKLRGRMYKLENPTPRKKK